MSDAKKRQVFEPLGMKCTNTDCEHGLHYFKPTKKHPLGKCRHCGAAPINWDRLHKQDIRDVAHTIGALQNEYIRHQMWQVAMDNEALRKARELGLDGLRLAVERRIRTKSFSGVPHPVYDGRQTPMHGNVIYYAQHATATCCRKCMHYWHGIPQDRPLQEEEIVYLTELIIKYCQERLPAWGKQDEVQPEER